MAGKGPACRLEGPSVRSWQASRAARAHGPARGGTATSFPARRPSQTARGLKAFGPLCSAHPPLAVCTANCCPDRFLPLCRLLPSTGHWAVGGGAPWPSPMAWAGAGGGCASWGLPRHLHQGLGPRFGAVACEAWEKETSGQTHPHCLQILMG